MWTFGKDWNHDGRLFSPTAKLAQGTNLIQVCQGMRGFMEKKFQKELEEILKTEANQNRTIPSELGGAKGVSSSMVASRNLENSGHFDLDGSISINA
mmetsp:Transcript_12931/g.19888  ORF Transcript_12931/g.19888 Transcript_12931/m.19888 type:complete len:97 (-) Transcript_12931:1044-1334(-)